MQVTRVRSKRDTTDSEERPSKVRIEQNLSELERRKIVATRVRSDTKVKQFHAGQIFEYLKDNLRLKNDQCLLVLTNADLYPKDGWTYVFGMTK